MSEQTIESTIKTPWHLWLVGIVGTLWSAMGALDFVMTQTHNEAYMSAFTQEQLDFFYGFPLWLIAAWGIAVWGGVIGSILLLLKKRSAVLTFLISLLAMVITTIQNYVLSNGMEIMGDAFSLVFTLVIFLASLGLYLYAKKMQSKGIIC